MVSRGACLAIAVFPLSVTAFVLVLSAPRGVLKGLVFILAWLACFVDRSSTLHLKLFATHVCNAPSYSCSFHTANSFLRC